MALCAYCDVIQQIEMLTVDLTFSSLLLRDVIAQQVNRDTIIYRMDDPAEELFMILAGKVLILKEDGTIFLTLLPGTYFGLVEMLENTTRQFFALAADNATRLLVVKK
jgi:CRP-like cAMP-binding protein